ncbi:MAG: tryptophan-rich sensory protein [Candidatus Uhrbacteria bacterium]|nr:tryptophan-rich sensory protein [Candidatus Uhrbacteria bacterium]
MNKQSTQFLTLILSIALAQAAGLIGSFFTVSSVGTWYATLTLPSFAPPSWVFGPAWITLYTLMGIAAYLVWRERRQKIARTALAVYGVHLVFNALWSVIFFGLRNPGLAFVEIILLLILIVFTTILFWRIDRRAGWLMMPYILWTSFAAYLNFSIWILN